MAREKKPVYKVQMTEGKRSIIQLLLQEYDIQSVEDKSLVDILKVTQTVLNVILTAGGMG